MRKTIVSIAAVIVMCISCFACIGGETAFAEEDQGFVINDKNIARLHQPHYVTIYSANMIHSYIPDLNIGHIHSADVMCYAPTKEEACHWLLSKIKSEENNV